MKKNLEDKIINDVYRFEKKRIKKTLFLYIFLLLSFLTLCTGTIFVTFQILRAQQTLDVLDIFKEDIHTIQANLSDVLNVLYVESPQGHLFIIFLSLVALIILSLIFLKNMTKIKKRFLLISKFFKEHNE